jgi:hypothetical protein
MSEGVFGTWQVRTHFARPNWKKVFSRVANIHKDSRIGMQSGENYTFLFSDRIDLSLSLSLLLMFFLRLVFLK